MSMFPIASATLTSAGAITFSSIPQNFTHLQIRLSARSDFASAVASGFIRFNGDSGSSYPYHFITGDGATPSASGTTAGTVGYLGNFPAASTAANIFEASITDILDYTNTNKNKTIRTVSGFDANGSGQIFYASSLWLNTAAITSILLVSGGGANFVTNTRADLYGIATSNATGA
jgi:hypothetical protein